MMQLDHQHSVRSFITLFLVDFIGKHGPHLPLVVLAMQVGKNNGKIVILTKLMREENAINETTISNKGRKRERDTEKERRRTAENITIEFTTPSNKRKARR